jgi:hypothetical protein
MVKSLCRTTVFEHSQQVLPRVEQVHRWKLKADQIHLRRGESDKQQLCKKCRTHIYIYNLHSEKRKFLYKEERDESRTCIQSQLLGCCQ